ncbi:tetratricopeptide repeat protein [Thermodesulfobacteriota bacterium]
MTRVKLMIISGALFVLMLLASVAFGSEATRTFLDGVSEYKKENYEKAIHAFSTIADSGVKSGKLFYNLGNAYLKNNELGSAILWYERALKLLPTDPDLKFNHAYALTLIKDAPEEKAPILRILFFWKHLLSHRAIQWISIMLNILLWLFYIIRTIRKKRAYRTIGYLLLVVTAIFTATVFYNIYETAYVKQAIILSSQISVRSGLADDATELFILHAGTKVAIERETDTFLRIYFSKGKIGWIKKVEAGMI